MLITHIVYAFVHACILCNFVWLLYTVLAHIGHCYYLFACLCCNYYRFIYIHAVNIIWVIVIQGTWSLYISLKGRYLLFYSQHNLIVLLLLISLANSSTIGSVDDSLCIGTAYSWIYMKLYTENMLLTLNIPMYRFGIPPILLPVLIISSLQNPLV